MNRSEILSAALLAPPHPRYGMLSYGREEYISALSKKSQDAELPVFGCLAWFVCTRPHDDPRLLELLKMDDPVPTLRTILHTEMHSAERGPFFDWYNEQRNAIEAAATKPGASGKPDEAPAEASPTF